MTDKSKVALEEALKLTANERAEVAEQLLASLDEVPDTDVEQAWQEEIQRRMQQVECGEVELIDSDTVIAELRNNQS
jgi:putative addiction module component (TIGR02574 family)